MPIGIIKNSLAVASTSQRANLNTLVEIPGTQGRKALLGVMAECGLVKAGRRRTITGRYGWSWTFTAEMTDGSGWWPVTAQAHKRLSQP